MVGVVGVNEDLCGSIFGGCVVNVGFPEDELLAVAVDLVITVGGLRRRRQEFHPSSRSSNGALGF